MSAFKGTPGPWSFDDAAGRGLQIYGNVGERDFVEFATRGEGRFPIFPLRPADSAKLMLAYEQWVQFPRGDWDRMQRANAALIAQAPAMLREIVDFIEGQRAPISPGSSKPSERNAALVTRASINVHRFEAILAALREGGAI